MADYFADQQERDGELITRLCVFAKYVREGVQKWLNREAQALQSETQKLLDDAPELFREDRQLMLDEIQDLNLHQLEDAVARLTERIDEIERALYDDPLEAHQHLIDSLAGVERVQRRLLKIRRRVDNVLRPDG